MLNPCKECGGTGRSFTSHEYLFFSSCFIMCEKCHKSTEIKTRLHAFDAREEAEEDWNNGLIS